MNQSEGAIYNIYEAGRKEASMFSVVKYWPVYRKIVS